MGVSRGATPHLGLGPGGAAEDWEDAQSWGVLVQPDSFPAAQQYLPFCCASVSPLQCFRSLGKGVSPGQGQAETPVLLQIIPSWGWGCRGHMAVRIRPQAQAGRRGRELFPARMRARTRLQQSCWQACAPRERGSRALCQLCLPMGTGTCGTQAAPPKRAQAVLAEKLLLSRRVPCRRYTTTRNQPRPAPSYTVLDGTQQCRTPAPPGFLAPPGRSWGCSPSQVHCQPLSPDGMETCQSKSPACHGGQGLCATASELGVGVEATGRGCLGGYAVFPSGLWSPASCPDTQPQSFAGIWK